MTTNLKRLIPMTALAALAFAFTAGAHHMMDDPAHKAAFQECAQKNGFQAPSDKGEMTKEQWKAFHENMSADQKTALENTKACMAKKGFAKHEG